MANQILLYYSYLSIIGLVLLFLRKDKELIYKDIVQMVFRDSFILTAFNIFVMYFILPITIPFSIMNIIKK